MSIVQAKDKSSANQPESCPSPTDIALNRSELSSAEGCRKVPTPSIQTTRKQDAVLLNSKTKLKTSRRWSKHEPCNILTTYIASYTAGAKRRNRNRGKGV
jgi:hypothetical protein